MNSALIGYTGFVGTTLRGQTSFDANFNSSNIQDIADQSYSLVVCAGAPAAKWIANQEPEADLKNLNMLMDYLKSIHAEQFVLISTVDVYQTPIGVDEQTPIDTESLHAYGKHRYFLEQFVAENFANHRIVRLPGLFGTGLRKNFLFDMIHKGESPWTHHASVFQFYNMGNLWHDLQTVLQSDLSLINFATEPVSAADVAAHAFSLDYAFETENPPVQYDMQTCQAEFFGATGPYIQPASDVLNQIRAFVEQEKRQT